MCYSDSPTYCWIHPDKRMNTGNYLMRYFLWFAYKIIKRAGIPTANNTLATPVYCPVPNTIKLPISGSNSPAVYIQKPSFLSLRIQIAPTKHKRHTYQANDHQRNDIGLCHFNGSFTFFHILQLFCTKLRT